MTDTTSATTKVNVLVDRYNAAVNRSSEHRMSGIITRQTPGGRSIAPFPPIQSRPTLQMISGFEFNGSSQFEGNRVNNLTCGVGMATSRSTQRIPADQTARRCLINRPAAKQTDHQSCQIRAKHWHPSCGHRSANDRINYGRNG